MAHFLQATIESVLTQDYPHIEYIVMDGGSNDGTVELLQSYGDRLHWVSEKDGGQADAVNRGFPKARGQIFTFLNADDTYLPGAVSAAVNTFQQHPDAGVIYGDAWYTAEDNSILERYPVQAYDAELLGSLCYICQPASFIRSDVFRQVGMLDPSLHLTLDYELWLRISKHYRMVKVDQVLANSRMYGDNKTLSRRTETFHEVIQITRKHRGYVPLNWLYGYAGHLLDGKDGFYEYSAPSLKKYALTLALGARHNPTRLPKFLREATSSVGLAAGMLWKQWSGRYPQAPSHRQP